jgi:hypothetical protein
MSRLPSSATTAELDSNRAGRAINQLDADDHR